MKNNNCMLDFPYPEIKVEKKDAYLSKRLTALYAGRYGEMTALTTYLYQHLSFKGKYAATADMLECLSLTEMRHFEMLGDLITALGGDPVIAESDRRRQYYWSGSYTNYELDLQYALEDDVRAEKHAIADYSAFIDICGDKYVNAVIERIIKDEEHHVQILTEIYKELYGSMPEED